MGMFDDIVKSAKSAAITVGKKAGDVVDYSKKKLAAADVQTKRNEAYENIGRLYYDTCKNGTDHADEINLLIESVDNYSNSLEEINNEIAAAKNTVECKACGAMNPAGANFCTNCANPLE